MKPKSSYISKVILGDVEQFSVNQRNYNALNLFFSIFSIFIALLSISKLQPFEILIVFLFSIGFATLYFVSRFLQKKRFWAFLVVTELFITFLLFISNGFNGTGVFLFLIAYSSFISISEKQNRWLILGIIVFHFSSLFFISYFSPELLSKRSHNDALLNWLYFITTAICVGFVINSLKLSYRESALFIEKQKKETADLLENVQKSIFYASTIQRALFPEGITTRSTLPDHFVLFLPRDIVSGDFYWINKVENVIVIAVGDCTGHGVPGAFMSMLAVSLLNDTVLFKKILHPNEILNELRTKIKMNLPNKYDGMDISIVTIDLIGKNVKYSGANLPLFIVRNGSLIECDSDHQPVGLHSKERDFTLHNIDFEPNDTFYMFSDGYVDQMNLLNKKFMKKRFKDLLLSVNNHPLSKQKEILEETFIQWKKASPENQSLTQYQFEEILLSLKSSNVLPEKVRLYILRSLDQKKGKNLNDIISKLKERFPRINEEILFNHIQKINNQTDDVTVLGFKIPSL